MLSRARRPFRSLLVLSVFLLGGAILGRPRPAPAEAAPLAAPSLGVIPASGPPGMTVSAVGSSWTFANNPYAIFWEAKGGTQLGTFSPDGPGNWTAPITIPSGASAGPHTIVACEGYTTEFEQCDSATFTVVPPTATATTAPTRTPTRTPTPPFGPISPVTWTPTRTPSITPLSGCIDGVTDISPGNVDLGGVPTTSVVVEVTLADPTTTHVRFFQAVSRFGGREAALYTQWPDPLPGTTVEAVADATVPNRWVLTVPDYPLRGGHNSIRVDLDPQCSGTSSPELGGPELTYLIFENGPEPTATPRPDVCGGLGLPADATIVHFEPTYPRMLDDIARETGVRFEGYLEPFDPRPILPRSGHSVGASIEGLEFGSATLPIRMAFDRPLSALGMFIGFPEPQYASGDVVASLSAYGYHPGSTDLVLLGGDSTTFPVAPTDVIHCLRFTAAEGEIIARALVEYTDADGNSLAERRLIDDLTLVYAEADLPPDAPPIVEITSPADGSSIPGTTINLRAAIREDRLLDRVAYQIDGGDETELGAYASLTDPASFLTGVNFSAALVEPGVPHLLSVTAYDSAGQFAQDTVTIIVPTPVPTVDLQAVKMEVVQVVQCLDNHRCVDNSVPMVIGKPTWVRVYVRAEGGTPGRPISGRLCLGRVATCDTGLNLPFNEILPDEDDDPSVNDRGNLDASLNFLLPPVWLTEGSLDLTAFINYREEDVDELNTENNVVQASVRVIRPRALTVMFTPVTADGMTAPLSEMWTFADWLARVFPVARVTAVGRANLPGTYDLSITEGSGCRTSWNRLLDGLRSAYTWGGRGTAYQFGLVPGGANTGGIIGCGETPGRVAASITSNGTRWGPIVGAQELGHNFGRLHATTCNDAENPDLGYPRPMGLLDDWGLDLVVRQLYPPVSSYDYMGYCGGPDNTWTSVHTYLGLIGTLPVAEAETSGAHLAAPFVDEGRPSLIGGGQISPQGFTLERGFYRAALGEGVEDNLPDGPYTAVLLDAAGTTLYTRTFNIIPLSNDEPTESGYFQIILPDFPEAAAIVFFYDGAEIGRVAASANPPEVSIIEPVGGEDWGASGAHTIAWQATDADGDALRFTVQYSGDGGLSWTAVDVDLAGASSIALDSADLPGGNLLFRVLASDGLNTAESATASPILVGNKAPQMHLASPANGDWIPAGEAVIFRGYATDPEDIVLGDDAYRWTSSLDGDLGAGPTLWGLPLSDGDHVITLEVTDRAGASASQSVTIRVGGETAEASAPPSALVLGLGLGGLILLLGAGIGALVYFVRSRPVRR